ncbi:MAG: guanylate kinase, partial [Planctomycetia bacterium]|nr:guanylate kinase [Planctomycetia bacterium]
MWVDGWGHLPGQLVVVSGPSGSGKSSVVRRVLDSGGLDLRLSVSDTTRDPRPGETPGLDYQFITPDEFRSTRDRKEYLEFALYNGNFYGTPANPVYQSLSERKSVILEIEVEGAKQIRESAPSALFVFIRTPTFRVLEERLRGRGTEMEPAINRRLRTARKELAEAHWYDYQVVNDDFDRCVEE